MKKELPRDDYTIGWICAIPIELAAATVMLDEHYEVPKSKANDTNIYECGRVREHNVVMACLPLGQTGASAASSAAMQMQSAFPAIRFGLMVGIGGGVPTEEADIHLGDVVISSPHQLHGVVVQYDLGKATPSGFERTGFLNTPPPVLLKAVSTLQASLLLGKGTLLEHVALIESKSGFAREDAGPDVLFEADYPHQGKESSTCGKCSKDHAVSRSARHRVLEVHYGTIASGNQVVRNAAKRDRLSAELGTVLCFEMEAAGLMNNFPCLVIRGICNYADSHENKRWRPYAAATAAAYAKELLTTIPSRDVSRTSRVRLAMAQAEILPLLYRNACIYEESKNRNCRRVPGTCNWFTSHTLFEEWNKSSACQKRLLYVTADPGCGKSVLFRYLIDEVLQQQGRAVCYFFFKDDFEDQRSIVRALCSVLHQLLATNRHLLTESVLQTYMDQGERFVESFTSIWDAFLLAACEVEVMCLFDALDECMDNERGRLMEAISTICNEGPDQAAQIGRPKFLVTSGPYEHIRAQISHKLDFQMSTIHLQGDRGPTAEAIVKEIDLVLKSRITEIVKIFMLNLDEEMLLTAQLRSVPNRTYLWIALIFDGLMGRASGLCKEDIMSLSKQLPQSIENAYEGILNKSSHPHIAERLLHIVLGPKRPLTTEEISIAIAFRGDQPSASVTDRIVPQIRIQEYIRGLCGLFVVIIDRKVYLMHQTAREFLIARDNRLQPTQSQGPHQDPVEFSRWRGSINAEHSDNIMANTCISYLHLRIETPGISFLDYAANYWAEHYRHSASSTQADLVMRARGLCLPEGRFWKSAFRQEIEIPEFTSALCLASALGLLEPVKLLLQELVTKHETLREVHEALSYAARNGHTNVVELFLRLRKVDVESKSLNSFQRTPLAYAAWQGHYDVMQLLEKHKAMVHSVDSVGMTPLSLASENGHEAIVMQLLKNKEVHVNHKDIHGFTPLYYAAMNGHEKVVKLLLGSNADVEVKTSEGRSLLSLAAEHGHVKLIEVLLGTKRVDVNSRDKADRTPLWYAILKKHSAATRALLRDDRIDIDWIDFVLGQTPLWYAASSGSEFIVKELLASGRPNVNWKDPYYYRTPLLAATCAPSLAAVACLLESGRVDPELTDKNGQTALQIAAANDDVPMVSILLQHGANIEAEDKGGRTPWSIAAIQGCGAVMNFLIKTGRVRVDFVDELGRTPLSHAARRGDLDLVKFLLEQGGNINAQDEYYCRTPLSYAAGEGHEDVVKILLEKKANPNIEDEFGQPPITHAAKGRHEGIVELLRTKAQANISQKDVFGQTPLYYVIKAAQKADLDSSQRSSGNDSSDSRSERNVLLAGDSVRQNQVHKQKTPLPTINEAEESEE